MRVIRLTAGATGGRGRVGGGMALAVSSAPGLIWSGRGVV